MKGFFFFLTNLTLKINPILAKKFKKLDTPFKVKLYHMGQLNVLMQFLISVEVHDDSIRCVKHLIHLSWRIIDRQKKNYSACFNL